MMLHYVLLFTIQKVACEACILQGFSPSQRCLAMPSPAGCRHDTVADVDARSMTTSRNTRSYTLRSVPSSPGREFLRVDVFHNFNYIVPPLQPNSRFSLQFLYFDMAGDRPP